MIIRPRRDWQAKTQPVTGPPYPGKSIVDVVYHYPGMQSTFADPVRSLRAMQADYLRNRGYSLGYSYGIDPTGTIWEIRGVDIRPAATAGYNDEGVAVLFMVTGQAPASDIQLTAAVDLHRWLEDRHHRVLGVTGHCFKGSTATVCPGAGIVAQLPEIERWVHDTGDDDDVTDQDVQRIADAVWARLITLAQGKAPAPAEVVVADTLVGLQNMGAQVTAIQHKLGA